jgi:LPXTG-motif cell wall-anchored protein
MKYMSIVGERWKNATDPTDLASINASIASVTASLNKAMALFQQASDALTTCYDKSQSACLQLTGGYAHSTWSPQYDNNKALIVRYKAELADLLTLQAQMAKTQASTASTVTQTAAADAAKADANAALAKADIATTGATATKWLLYAGIGVGVVVLAVTAFVMFKKYKKKL